MNQMVDLAAASDIADIAGSLRGETVLVTGASGFIGGRLIERLLIECGAKPRALIRDYSRAARLARFGLERVELALGSLSDAGNVEEAVSGCKTVFHCAYDFGKPDVNLAGTRALMNACIMHGARLVHVSTISVYEPLPDGDLDETAKPKKAGLAYGENKIDLEDEVLQAVRERGLDAVIVMPTIVYGPFGKAWTLGPAKQIASGTVLLPDDGLGLCNAVHVDDVCQTLLRAAVMPNAKGQRYFASAAEPVTWQAFFQAYASALDRPGPAGLSKADLQRRNTNPLSAIKLLLGDPKRIIRWAPTRALAFWAKDNLPPTAKELVKKLYKTYRRVAPAPIYTPDPDKMALYSAKCRVKIDKARTELGYKPAFDLRDGMKDTGGWVRWAIPREG